ncbi:MAG: ABC transporter ATP-binding protein/permease [Firmicutes bacterium]|nr:ABC transporter ATP-binding protein/permease [Bacillota bacterium]
MRTLRRLIAHAKKDWPYFTFAALATLAVTGLNLWAPLVIRNILGLVRTGRGATAWREISRAGLVLLGIYLLRAACQFVARYFNHVGGWNLVARMRSLTYDHLQKLSLRFFQDKQTGQLMSRTIYDNANLENLSAHALPDLMTNVLLLAGVTALLFKLNGRLALYTLIPMPLLILGVARFALKIRPALRRVQATLGELNALVQDNLSGIKEIQLFTQEERESERVRASAYGFTRGMLAALKKTAFYHPAFEFVTALGTLIVVWLGGHLIVVEKAMDPETLVAFLLYLGMFYGPVTSIGRIVEDVQTALAGAERVFEILDTEPDVKDAPGARPLPKVRGAIEFDRVSFAYRPGQPVLEEISFTVPPGTSLALVGPTGVGKTTIASLIPRFYDPTAGRVLIDGYDLRQVRIETLRSQISLVLQDVFLFYGTVAENILYGSPHATEAEMKRAAELARADEFIRSLPEGYETKIGERGVKLSGGQRQRLAIARAILRNAPILILDEATSAVDTETEAEIQAALRELMAGRTTVIIAHRLSTVREADQILVLENGRIVELGRHGELLARGGLYSRLYRMQFREAGRVEEVGQAK